MKGNNASRSTSSAIIFSLTVLAVGIGNASPSSAGLAGLWRFNETAGPALDSSGQGNAGTFIGAATRAPGMTGFGTAGSFANDGGDNYVQVQADPSLMIGATAGAPWTLAAWALEDPGTGTPGSHQANYGTILHYQRRLSDDVPYPTPDYGLSLQSGSNGDSQLYLWHGTNSAWQRGTGITPTINDWVHYAMVYDGSDLRVFVNGVQQYSASVGSADVTYFSYDGALQIGGGPGFFSDRNWNGLLDDVAIFDEALDALQLATIMSGDFTAFGVPEPGSGLLLLSLGQCLIMRRRFIPS